MTFREGNGTPLQYSCLENPMDGGAWWAAVHGVAKSRTQLSKLTFTFHFHALEKEMATHSSVLAWRIPGTGKLGGLLSVRSHRVGQDWSDLAAAATSIDFILLHMAIKIFQHYLLKRLSFFYEFILVPFQLKKSLNHILWVCFKFFSSDLYTYTVPHQHSYSTFRVGLRETIE